ncbi:sacsin N-terminal ATP-binding-like domain-containing protein [Castellaniella sp.]|uniref:sacsin N-terminal ATP-binding-like domain-containing protein n=1 Tax=Castellaniella sp. TaxID=1955812 RepID=UPI003A91ECA0
MATNYEQISQENRRRYGTEGGQKSGDLAARLYDDRTHFIFELLQNAEDALKKRGKWGGERKVSFTLDSCKLVISHFGKPFDENDVRSICDIAESTKNESSIGRFGLGFKSVYAITDLPEIHSGDEDFVIEGYVFPKGLIHAARTDDETQIVLPLKPGDTNAVQDITAGFRRLGPRSLLFLHNIEEIGWSVEGGASGFYLRSAPITLAPGVQRIQVIGGEDGEPEVDQNWLVFHRSVFSDEGKSIGQVEIAFSVVAAKGAPDRWTVQPLAKSPLVVFFPTVVESHLGFLAQGPYCTTPGRDNIPPGDSWNQHLVKETSSLLIEALHWMRDEGMLNVSTLRCLPLDREKFPPDSQFAPMFDAVLQAFQEDALLPAFDGKHVSASQAKLARTQELRELFNPDQVVALFDSDAASWLSDDITEIKTPEIRKYLMRELNVEEIRPEKVIPNLSKAFLEDQPDEWISRLYEFLGGQKALRHHITAVPLIRLDDGTHVVAHENGEAKAFLPTTVVTGFPTVRRTVCETAEALAFLSTLGITEPDPVDDVIRNILPKYRQDEVNLDDGRYTADIRRILTAFNTDSKTQRDKLLSALRDTSFVMAVDTGNGTKYVARPGDVYISTDRLKKLFENVPNVIIVDDNYAGLRGEDIRELLEACGAVRYPRPESAPPEHPSSDRLKDLRTRAGHADTSGYSDYVEDWVLHGFQDLLNYLPKLAPEQRAERSRLIWESLGDLEDRRGRGIFDGTYKWSHNGKYNISFPAAFLRNLNTTAWVPDASGDLVLPSLVVFDALGWKSNPFLLTKIDFKPPIIDQLAKEAGIDPAALDLLRKHGITSVADLASRLGIAEQPPEDETSDEALSSEPSTEEETDDTDSSGDDVYSNAKDLYGDDMPEIPPGTPDPHSSDGATRGAGHGSQGRTGTGTPRGGGQSNGAAHGGSGGHTSGGKEGGTSSKGQGKRAPGSAGGRPFISYVGTHPDDEESDPDGLDQATRMKIEEEAISLIISLESGLQRTPDGNPGFDLFEANSDGQQVRWVEVKSMTGSLENRPVGLSHTQFDYARAKGDAYWLYVVEYATDCKKARVRKIQNPAGHARTFTFDRGWIGIAQTAQLRVTPLSPIPIGQ